MKNYSLLFVLIAFLWSASPALATATQYLSQSEYITIYQNGPPVLMNIDFQISNEQARNICRKRFGGAASFTRLDRSRGVLYCDDGKGVSQKVDIRSSKRTNPSKVVNQNAKQTTETDSNQSSVGTTIAATRRSTEKPAEISSGTGFLISRKGHIVTSAHVVAGCKEIKVRLYNSSTVPASLVTAREDMDLALVFASGLSGENTARLRPSNSVVLGEDAIAFGFPLVGALSTDGSLSTGSVSSLSGLQDDISMFQISLPIQPGNSGGALLDRKGGVIGVIIGKLNAIEVAKVTGDIPQNVNFAVKSDELLRFLDWIGTEYEIASTGEDKSNADIAAAAQKFTTMVECNR